MRDNMMFKKKVMILLYLQLLIPLLTRASQNSALEGFKSEQVNRFDKIELEFTSENSYDNPYTEGSFSARVTPPSGTEFEVDGFWDGGNIWKLRIMATEIGEYFYTTSSDDPGLNRKSGSFQCVESEHPGMLIVNGYYPYTFKLSNGGPFFWMGETSWLMMSDAASFSEGVFQKLIDIRISQKFNNIHFVLGTGGLPIGTHNPKNEGGYLWISQEEQKINPGFLQWMDRRVDYVHEKQMVLGFFITWAQHYSEFTKEEYKRLERYLIARYAAYPLLYWVIVGEFDESGKISDYNDHGEFIDERDPYGHLISNHPGHADPDNLGTSRIFVGQSWFDFIIQQFPDYPGHYDANDINNALIEDRNKNLPVVNIEFGYEEMEYKGKVFSKDIVRKSAWATAVGGGFPSYGHKETMRTVDVDYLKAPGANYMTILYDFFTNLNWWEMQPENERVDNGFCLSRDVIDYVIYLPDGGVVNVDLRENVGIYLAKWFNPQTGSYNDTQKVVGGSMHRYQSPYDDDAVLLLHAVVKPAISVEPDTLSFEMWKGGDNVSTKTVTVDNAGGDSLVWRAVEYPDEPWLSLDNTTGIAGEQLMVAIDITSLDKGSYSARIMISSDNASNSPVYVNVQLNIREQNAELAVAPKAIDFGASDDSIQVELLNIGNSTLTWQVNAETIPQWISSIEPEQGVLPGGQSEQILLVAARTNLQPGNYSHNILIQTDYNNAIVTAAITEPNTNTENYFARINCGSSQNYVDTCGNLWQADQPYSAGSCGYLGGSAFSSSDPIANTEDDVLFQSERWGMSGYNFDVENGLYEIMLMFAEIYFRESGRRIFSVFIEQNEVLPHFDVFAEVGHDYATTRTFTAHVDDNQLNIKFTSIAEDWKISAIQVIQKKSIPQNQLVAASFDLYQNYPNPFKLSTSIAFDLPFSSSLKMDIYNVLGQKIASDIYGPFSEGFQYFTWKAIDAAGQKLPSGMYFYQLKMVEQQRPVIQQKKMIINK